MYLTGTGFLTPMFYKDPPPPYIVYLFLKKFYPHTPRP